MHARAIRIIAGLALIVAGGILGGGWWALAVVGVIPLGAGALDLCLFDALFHKPLPDSKGKRMNTTPAPIIEVFADIWCPFTHVGLRAIDEQRIRAGRTDAGIRVRAWPLELVNGAPLDPVMTKEHADDLRRQVAPHMFRHLDVERFPRSTLDALELANRAYRTSLQVGERVSFSLRDLLFENGCDISDLSTLEQVASEYGIEMPDESDHADVVADWHAGVQRGVLGSPHFFCGTADVFCPSLHISNDPDRGVSIVRDASRLTEFLERCLAQPGTA